MLHAIVFDPQNERMDRFIPNRSTLDIDAARYKLSKETAHSNNYSIDSSASPAKDAAKARLFNKALAAATGTSACADDLENSRVLSFTNRAPEPDASYLNDLRVVYSQNKTKEKCTIAKATRYIPNTPERILDAPELSTDYYLNLIDWSSSNVLAVALGPSVYLWNAATGGIEELMTIEDPEFYVSSVSFSSRSGNILSIGTSTGVTELWDVNRMARIRKMDGHSARVGSLAWNESIISSGSKDSTIINHDVRIAQHHTATLVGHQQEVCGLKWNYDGRTLASGGNDNLLSLWDASASASASSGTREVTARLVKSEHSAAVKALAWCPFQRNVLASGGGTADRTIKFWNTGNGELLNSIDTGSQVCSLLWSSHEKELLSSHGFSKNQLCVWKYPSLQLVKELHGHTERVLHMTASPDGQTVCSAGADETLRFWKIFGNQERGAPSGAAVKKATSASQNTAMSSMSRMR
jgi:cell division cycle protein 20 (cofactor of APC complex)